MAAVTRRYNLYKDAAPYLGCDFSRFLLRSRNPRRSRKINLHVIVESEVAHLADLATGSRAPEEITDINL